MNFFLFVLSTIGLTNIFVDSSLFDSLRDLFRNKASEGKRFFKFLNSIFSCHQCMGFWCGLFCGLILISYNPLVVLTCGFASSFLSVLAANYLNYLEAGAIVIGNTDE